MLSCKSGYPGAILCWPSHAWVVCGAATDSLSLTTAGGHRHSMLYHLISLAQVHSLSAPKECTICDEMHIELLWCETCSRCACLECNRQEAPEADDNKLNAEELESSSVGSGVFFCFDCGQTTAYVLPLAHQTQCSKCDGCFWVKFWCECCRAFTWYE